MNACILFILFSGAGYVTPACFTPYGEILEPQDVIYVQHLPEAYHHIVYESPRRYVRHYRPHRRYVRHWRGYRHNHRHHNIRRHRNIRPNYRHRYQRRHHRRHHRRIHQRRHHQRRRNHF